MTHSFQNSRIPTLQALAGLCQVAGFDYTVQLSHILEIIGQASVLEFPTLAQEIASSLFALVSLLRELGDNVCSLAKTSKYHTDRGQKTGLAHLLDLMTKLSCFLPNFGRHLLMLSEEAGHSKMLNLLCALVVHQLSLPDQNKSVDFLAREAVKLLESLCWQATKDNDSAYVDFGFDCSV
jgi:hypothetical protein